MEVIKILAERRNDVGKGVARKLRAGGKLPGVIYGPDVDPFPVAVDAKEFSTMMRIQGGAGKLIDLTVNGEETPRKVILRELQRDPVSGVFEHVDLYQVSMKKKLIMTARITLVGISEGVKLGGILQSIIRELDIACLPMDIPDRVELDVSALEIGDSIHVRNINIDKVDILTNPERTVVTVVPPTVIKVAEAEEEAEGEEGEEGEGEGEGEAAEGEAAPAEGDAKAKKDEGEAKAKKEEGGKKRK